MNGISERMAAALREHGINTIDDLADAGFEDLLEVPGIGEKTAETLQTTAFATLEELDRIVETTVAEELAKIAEDDRPLFDESRLEGEAPVAGEEATEQLLEPNEIVVDSSLFEGFEDRVSELASDEAEAPAAEAELRPSSRRTPRPMKTSTPTSRTRGRAVPCRSRILPDVCWACWAWRSGPESWPSAPPRCAPCATAAARS